MILVRAPYRISFFGGGTDYESWFVEHGGAVLSTTIDKYCWLMIRDLPSFFPQVNYRIVWSHVETVATPQEILHPCVKAAFELFPWAARPVEIHHMGDLPARSGMGSSSAFAVALLRGLFHCTGDSVAPRGIADLAIQLERSHMQEAGGWQDQIACSLGGFNHIQFGLGHNWMDYKVPVPVGTLATLGKRLLLFYTKTTRIAARVSQSVQEEAKPKDLEVLQCMPEEGIKALMAADLDHFGKLLDIAWTVKRRLSNQVSNERIDALYWNALQSGAIGGKLLGAGGGGFLLLYVPEKHQETTRSVLTKMGCVHVDFRFERSGCRVVYER